MTAATLDTKAFLVEQYRADGLKDFWNRIDSCDDAYDVMDEIYQAVTEWLEAPCPYNEGVMMQYFSAKEMIDNAYYWHKGEESVIEFMCERLEKYLLEGFALAA